MIIVMACASGKNHTGSFTQKGRLVQFVADPPAFRPEKNRIYTSPADPDQSWHKKLRDYNRPPKHNPLNFLPAGALYSPPVYAELRQHLKANKFYILSAAWGLIRSDFLLPGYNITFSNQAENGFRRRATEKNWPDFNRLPKNTKEDIFCFGGKDYVDFFMRLTSDMTAPRHAFRRVPADQRPSRTIQNGIHIHTYPTNRMTNWHHSCALDFIHKRFTI